MITVLSWLGVVFNAYLAIRLSIQSRWNHMQEFICDFIIVAVLQSLHFVRSFLFRLCVNTWVARPTLIQEQCLHLHDPNGYPGSCSRRLWNKNVLLRCCLALRHKVVVSHSNACHFCKKWATFESPQTTDDRKCDRIAGQAEHCLLVLKVVIDAVGLSTLASCIVERNNHDTSRKSRRTRTQQNKDPQKTPIKSDRFLLNSYWIPSRLRLAIEFLLVLCLSLISQPLCQALGPKSMAQRRIEELGSLGSCVSCVSCSALGFGGTPCCSLLLHTLPLVTLVSNLEWLRFLKTPAVPTCQHASLFLGPEAPGQGHWADSAAGTVRALSPELGFLKRWIVWSPFQYFF